MQTSFISIEDIAIITRWILLLRGNWNIMKYHKVWNFRFITSENKNKLFHLSKWYSLLCLSDICQRPRLLLLSKPQLHLLNPFLNYWNKNVQILQAEMCSPEAANTTKSIVAITVRCEVTAMWKTNLCNRPMSFIKNW